MRPPASIVSQSNTAIVVTLADIGAKKGAVVITADTGAVVSSAGDSFEYLTKGVITKVVCAVIPTDQNSSAIRGFIHRF